MAHPLVASYEVNAGAVPAEHWQYDAVEGGGRWMGEGGHFVDLLQYLIGADPAQVFARTTAPAGEPGASFVVSIGFRHCSSRGTTLYVDGADQGAWRERVNLFGRGMTCTLEDFKRGTLARGGRLRRVRLAEAERGYPEELAAWIQAVRGEAPAPVEISAYAATTGCCLAAVESARTGMPMDVEVMVDVIGNTDNGRDRA